MNTFIWIALIALIFVLYSGFILYRTRRHSRFQARLSVLFFIFMLIPILPLLLFFSSLFIKSSDLMAPPGIESALNQSLELIRLDLEEKGSEFFKIYPDWQNINYTHLNTVDAAYYLVWQGPDQEPVKRIINPGYVQILQSENLSPQRQSGLREIAGNTIFEYHQQLPDSLRACIGLNMDTLSVSSIRQLNQLMRNYTTFGLLKDTVLERHLIWLLALVLTILLAFISFQLAKTVSGGLSGPIVKLSEGMKIVGSGDLTHQVNVNAKDEIGFLVDSFNNMTTELRINRENLKKAERAAAWRDVARQISHEIKNPLTPIELSLYRMKSSLPDNSELFADISESIRIIEEEIGSIRGLANSFSEFAKMPGLKLEMLNIANIIKDCTSLYKDYPVEFTEITSAAPLHADREQLRRALNNLIKNAIEASTNNQPVIVQLEKSDDPEHRAVIRVIDQGVGINPDHINKVLKPYYTTKEKGTGLGLFIVNRIVSEHGGTLTIKSQPGKGTTMEILL